MLSHISLSTPYILFNLLVLALTAPALNPNATFLTLPHHLRIPEDPSVYHIGDGPFRITFRDLGEALDYSDAVHMLDDAHSKIAAIIHDHHHQPHGGQVRSPHEWVHQSVRLTTSPNPPWKLDYDLLQLFLAGVASFARDEGGYWACRMSFLRKIEELGEKGVYRKLGSAELMRVR